MIKWLAWLKIYHKCYRNKYIFYRLYSINIMMACTVFDMLA